MEERQKIDSVVADAHQKVQKEIEGLIGTSFSLSEPRTDLISRETCLTKYTGSHVLTRFQISGGHEGSGWLIVAVSDAIRMGGTLIMLPETELDELVDNTTFDEETQDSYGEIGNIISGTYSSVFEQSLEFQSQFERKEHHIKDFPADDSRDEQLLTDSKYYLVTSSIHLDGKLLESLDILFPAVALGLIEESSEQQDESVTEEVDQEQISQADEDSPPVEETIADGHDDMNDTETDDVISTEDPILTDSESTSELDTEQKRTDIDALLEMCRVRVQEEVGEVVGGQLSCSEMRNIVSTKEQFYLDETKGKQIAVGFNISGAIESCCYLYIGLKDAIRLGGTLMMLPPDELEDVVSEATFNSDIQDAYEEVTRVISNVYDEIFSEHYNGDVHFEKGEIETIVPMKVDVDSTEPIENQKYYINRLKVALEGENHGWLQTLFPSAMFGLEDLEPELSDNFTQRDDGSSQQSIPEDSGIEHDNNSQCTSLDDSSAETRGSGNLLIIGDEDNEAEHINDMLETLGVSVSHVNFRDKINDYLPGTFQAVILLMNDVDEQSLGVAIKINASCSLPLVAIGSKWTRSKVLKALKYGVHDIIPTPVTEEDLKRKISCHMTSIAA